MNSQVALRDLRVALRETRCRNSRHCTAGIICWSFSGDSHGPKKGAVWNIDRNSARNSGYARCVGKSGSVLGGLGHLGGREPPGRSGFGLLYREFPNTRRISLHSHEGEKGARAINNGYRMTLLLGGRVCNATLNDFLC